jgi:hypothetical protein
MINNIKYYAHKFTHSNINIQYSRSPRLHIGYYIHGTTVSSALSLRQMCSTCIIESGFFPLGIKNSISTGYSSINLTTAGTAYVMMVLKVKSGYDSALVKPLNISTLYKANTGSIGGICQVQLHSTVGSIGVTSPTLSSLSYTSLPNSICEYYIGDGVTTVTTDGFTTSTLLVATSRSATYGSNDFETLLTRAIATKYDYLVFVGIPSTNNDRMIVSVDFIESV